MFPSKTVNQLGERTTFGDTARTVHPSQCSASTRLHAPLASSALPGSCRSNGRCILRVSVNGAPRSVKHRSIAKRAPPRALSAYACQAMRLYMDSAPSMVIIAEQYTMRSTTASAVALSSPMRSSQPAGRTASTWVSEPVR